MRSFVPINGISEDVLKGLIYIKLQGEIQLNNQNFVISNHMQNDPIEIQNQTQTASNDQSIVGQFFESVADHAIDEVFESAFDKVINVAKPIANSVIDNAGATVDTVMDVAGSAASAAADVAGSAASAAADAAGAAASAAVDIAGSIVGSLLDGI